jgi:hypothetical protein
MRSRAFSTRHTALWQNLSGLWHCCHCAQPMRSTPHASPALAGRGEILSKAVRAVPSNRLLSQSLDSLLFGLNFFQLRFDCGFAMTSQGYVGSRLRATYF